MCSLPALHTYFLLSFALLWHLLSFLNYQRRDRGFVLHPMFQGAGE